MSIFLFFLFKKKNFYLNRCQHVGGSEPDGYAFASSRRFGFGRQQRPPPPTSAVVFASSTTQPSPQQSSSAPQSEPAASLARPATDATNAEESRKSFESKGVVGRSHDRRRPTATTTTRRRQWWQRCRRTGFHVVSGLGCCCSCGRRRRRCPANPFGVGFVGRRGRFALVRPSEHGQFGTATTSTTSFATLPLSGCWIVSGRSFSASAESVPQSRSRPRPQSRTSRSVWSVWSRHGRPGGRRRVCAHGRAHGRPQFAAERPVSPCRPASTLPSARLSESVGCHCGSFGRHQRRSCGGSRASSNVTPIDRRRPSFVPASFSSVGADSSRHHSPVDDASFHWRRRRERPTSQRSAPFRSLQFTAGQQ